MASMDALFQPIDLSTSATYPALQRGQIGNVGLAKGAHLLLGSSGNMLRVAFQTATPIPGDWTFVGTSHALLSPIRVYLCATDLAAFLALVSLPAGFSLDAPSASAVRPLQYVGDDFDGDLLLTHSINDAGGLTLRITRAGSQTTAVQELAIEIDNVTPPCSLVHANLQCPSCCLLCVPYPGLLGYLCRSKPLMWLVPPMG